MSKAELILFLLHVDLFFHLSGWSFVHPVTQSISVTLYCRLYSHTALPKTQISPISAALKTLNGLPLPLGLSQSSLTRLMRAPHDQPLHHLSSVTSCHCLIYSFIQWTWMECVRCARHYSKCWATAVKKVNLSFPGARAILIYSSLFPFTAGPICTECTLLRKLIVLLLPKPLPPRALPCLANIYSSFRSLLLSRLA